jgi:hypothetical protein
MMVKLGIIRSVAFNHPKVWFLTTYKFIGNFNF